MSKTEDERKICTSWEGYALEVLAIGHIRYQALLPCLIAALIADAVVDFTGVHHTAYHLLFHQEVEVWANKPGDQVLFLMKIIVAGILFGLVSSLFAKLCHEIKHKMLTWIKPQWLIPVIGASAIIGLTYALGTHDYLGLGVRTPQGGGNSIVNAFLPKGVDTWSWMWKLLFTAITLGTGFKGGEVTPLFFIGATLGCSLATLFGMPSDLFAALGFIAVFAGATNTPIACTIMGVELFGGEYVVFFALACFTAYYFSGSKGIYSAQRVAVSKGG